MSVYISENNTYLACCAPDAIIGGPRLVMNDFVMVFVFCVLDGTRSANLLLVSFNFNIFDGFETVVASVIAIVFNNIFFIGVGNIVVLVTLCVAIVDCFENITVVQVGYIIVICIGISVIVAIDLCVVVVVVGNIIITERVGFSIDFAVSVFVTNLFVVCISVVSIIVCASMDINAI